MANKQKYEKAKQAAWYADEMALKVLDELREQEKVDDKPKTRSSYLNDLLLKMGLDKGLIEPPPKKEEPLIIPPEHEGAVRRLLTMLKNENQRRQKAAAI